MDQDWHVAQVEDADKWQALLLRCQMTDLQQSWLYGQAVQECAGWQSVRQVVSQGNNPAALAQTLVRQLPNGDAIARIQHGPLFIDHGNGFCDQAIAAIKILKEYWTDERGTALFFSPCLLPEMLPSELIGSIEGVEPAPEDLWQSVRVDVQLSDRQLRKNMQRQWRRALHKAEKAGLVVTVCDTKSLRDLFLEYYRRIAREKKFGWPSADLIASLWRGDDPVLTPMIAYRDQKPIAGILLFRCCDVVTGFAAWNEPLSGKYHAHHLLIWESIQLARRCGCRWFDLGGIDPLKLPGITAFKRRIGGQEYTLGGNYFAATNGGSCDADIGAAMGDCATLFPGVRPSTADQCGGVTQKVTAIVSRFVTYWPDESVSARQRQSLIDGGLIDSLTLVNVIQALQGDFDVDIGVADITRENFDSIERIGRFISARQTVSA